MCPGAPAAAGRPPPSPTAARYAAFAVSARAGNVVDGPPTTIGSADHQLAGLIMGFSAALGIDVEAVRRDPATRGFAALPRRWAVERTFGWLMLHRRLRPDRAAEDERKRESRTLLQAIDRGPRKGRPKQGAELTAGRR
jgi:transposase